MTKQLASSRIPWIWVLAAFLIASTRLFESGLGLDPALFASIARTMSRNNIWWSPSASAYLFPTFGEHPYLAIWLQAINFKIFGASDWSARILGACFGALSFFFLFRLAERFVSTRFANLYCFCMLLSAHFMGRMANFFFDVPMVFFGLGGLYFASQTLDVKKFRAEILAGLFFGAAFLTKGMAALPLLAILAWMFVTWLGVRALWDRSLYLIGVLTVVCVLGFLVAQNYFGTYSFWELYLNRQAVTKYLRWTTFQTILRLFFQAHGVHVLLGLSCVLFWKSIKETRRAIIFGAGSTAILLTALSAIDRVLFHYFYILFPFCNLLTAATLYAVTRDRGVKIRWERVATGIAIFYVVLWQILPLPMRRKPEIDYFQLKGIVHALKAHGVPELQGIGFSEFDWVYRELSLWYWDMDTDVKAISLPTKEAVITPITIDFEGQFASTGYRFCAASPQFRIWVRSALLEQTCRKAEIPKEIIR